MTLYDLLLGDAGARASLEEDETEYYWSLSELTAYFNRAEREAAERSLCLKYRHSSDIIGAANSGLPAKLNDTVCALSISSGISEYELSAKVLRVERARISTEEIPLARKTRMQMDEINESWMDSSNSTDTPEYFISEVGQEFIVYPVPDATYTVYLILSVLPKYPMAVPEYGTDISFDSTGKIISRAAGNFITNGYQAGQRITISGSANNNGVKTIASVTSNTALVVTETVTTEAAGATVIISSTPEIPEQYHENLIDYVIHLALLKRGKKTEDQRKSLVHLGLFEKVFGQKKTAAMVRARRTTPMDGGMMEKKWRI